MTIRETIYNFLLAGGSNEEAAHVKAATVMDLLIDDRPIVYEMLEDILQSDNLVRATETDKNPTLEQELLFICPSLRHMPRVLASVVLMVNENGVIDPNTANQLILIDRALAERKATVEKLEQSAEMLDLCREYAKYSFEETNWDFKCLTRKEKQIFKDRDTWARFCRWVRKDGGE